MSNRFDLEEKILAELDKTGFPTEIVAASVMQVRGWAVLHNPSYFDADEGKSREFDIRAYRHKSKDIPSTNSFASGVYLVTECKKSEKPWVFFTTLEVLNHVVRLGGVIKWNLGVRKQIFTDNFNAESVISDGSLKRFHHYFEYPRLARTFHQPFRGKRRVEDDLFSRNIGR